MEDLKTCHQCRQRTTNWMAMCKNLKERKACTLKFCKRCLLNRYEEKIEEVVELKDWKCPKCRNNCNCSVCLKRKGNEPLGKLKRAVRDEGYSSVSQLLSVKPKEYLKPTGSSQHAVTITSKMETPIVPAREQESTSHDVFKEKKELKRKQESASHGVFKEKKEVKRKQESASRDVFKEKKEVKMRQESASHDIFKEKKEVKRKREKWCSKFVSLKPFFKGENEESSRETEEQTVESDVDE